MIDTEKLISILIDDDIEQFLVLYSNYSEKTFKITNNKHKYFDLLKKSEGAPLISIAAFFGSKKCYDYLAGDETDIPSFDISPLAYACAGGDMYFVHDISSKFQETPDSKCGEFAIYYGHLDIVKWLILKGYKFPINQIIIAFQLGYEDITNFFLENNDFSKFDNNCNVLITSTCEGGNEKILSSLLTEYKNKKFGKKEYQNFINSAIRYGNITCVKYLITNSHMFFPRVYSSFIQSSFLCASNYDYLDIIVYLNRLGGKIEDNESEVSPLTLALVSNSYNTSKYFLNNLPKIDTDTIIEYISTVFEENYSISIIQLLLKYINKTLFDMKEYLTKLALKYKISIFFDDLKDNGVSLDFIKIEYFNEYANDYDIYIKLVNLNVHFNYDIHNQVFLNALKDANEGFLKFAFNDGAVLNDEIIAASRCIEFQGNFFKNDKLIRKLFDAKINLSNYTNFLNYLIDSCGRKVFIYELLATDALDFGACLNKEVFLAAFNKKWLIFFKKAAGIQYFGFDVDDIPLSELYGQYYYEKMMEIIFDKQPLLVNQLIRKIDRLHIKNTLTEFIKRFKPFVPTNSVLPDINMSINIENILLPIFDRRK